MDLPVAFGAGQWFPDANFAASASIAPQPTRTDFSVS